jgi:cysteine-rich repeat protein
MHKHIIHRVFLILVIHTISVSSACGDFILEDNEVCDDGNKATGDGCDDVCQLEAGYMCAGFKRETKNGLSNVYITDITNASFISRDEQCGPGNICLMSHSMWKGPLHNGYYCADFCRTFTPDDGYTHKPTDECEMIDVDECKNGLSTCDANAYCTNLNVTQGVGKYECRCASDYFTTEENGKACSEHGIEIEVKIVYSEGKSYSSDDLDDVKAIQSTIIDAISVILKDGKQNLVTESSLLPSYDEGLQEWTVTLRFAVNIVNMELVNHSKIDEIFNGLTINEDYKIGVRSSCSNDRRRPCSMNTDCLFGDQCQPGIPHYDISIMSAGGSTAANNAFSSGMQLISLDYSVRDTGWIARIRYDDTVPDTIDILYVSHIPRTSTSESMGSFASSNFPCQFSGITGTDLVKSDTVCCLANFNTLYTTTEKFGEYIQNTKLTEALEAGQYCDKLYNNTPPPDHTKNLLNTSVDFVTGKLNRMPRSSAVLESIKTVGYRDIVVFLAQEDMKEYGGVDTDTIDGFYLKFFIGMAHIKTLSTNRISTTFSQLEISSKITSSFMFTTSAKTDNTFIRDVGVSLSQVRRNDINGTYAKFARVQLTLPTGSAADDYSSIIPLNSATVSIGYTPDVTGDAIYPCIETYDGTSDRSVAINSLLNMRKSEGCSFIDPVSVCAAQGIEEIGSGGQLFFMFPLSDDVWERDTIDEIFYKNIYISFAVSIIDQTGKRVLTTVKTMTPITRNSIITLCEDTVVNEASIAEIMRVDMFLGLVPTLELFNQSLVQALDITNNPNATKLLQNASSTAANIITMLVGGPDDLFAQAYAESFSVEIEDMITIHFLEENKKKIVEEMINSGLAFTRVKDPNMPTDIRLLPTDALLEMCPVNSIKGVLGCVTRLDVSARINDFKTGSINSFAPDSAEDEEVYRKSGLWLQGLLQPTDFIYELGYNHSKVMAEKFDLNSRYKKGFMIAPTVPWKQTDMDDAKIESTLELSQHSVTIVLVSMDQNRGDSNEPVLEVNARLETAVTGDDLRRGIADTLGIPSDLVEVEPVQTRRRRLLSNDLQLGHTLQYNINIKIPVNDKVQAKSVADELSYNLADKDSSVLKKLMRVLNSIIMERYDTKRTKQIQNIGELLVKEDPPTVQAIQKCNDVQGFNLKITPELAMPNTFGDGYLSCTKRWVANSAWAQDTLEYDINIRGPRDEVDWYKYRKLSMYLHSTQTKEDLHKLLQQQNDENMIDVHEISEYNFVTGITLYNFSAFLLFCLQWQNINITYNVVYFITL